MSLLKNKSGCRGRRETERAMGSGWQGGRREEEKQQQQEKPPLRREEKMREGESKVGIF